jgi:hypothetical protein
MTTFLILHFWFIFFGGIAALTAACALWKFKPWCRKPFINRTHGAVTDTGLRLLWVAARANIAYRRFDLSPLTVVPSWYNPDRRALDLWPRAITVETVRDLKQMGKPMNGLTSVGFWRPTKIQVAATSAGIDAIAYEFENVILARLGYSVEAR